MQHIPTHLGADLDRHQVQSAAGQGVGGGVGAEGVAEEQDHRAQDRRHQDRQGDEPPVLQAEAPQILGRLTPLTLQPVEAGAMISTISGNWKYM